MTKKYPNSMDEALFCFGSDIVEVIIYKNGCVTASCFGPENYGPSGYVEEFPQTSPVADFLREEIGRYDSIIPIRSILSKEGITSSGSTRTGNIRPVVDSESSPFKEAIENLLNSNYRGYPLDSSHFNEHLIEDIERNTGR